MTVRQRALQAIKRENGDFIPFEFNLCDSLYEKFKEKTGATNHYEYYKMPYQFIYLENTNSKVYEKYYDSLDRLSIKEFGVGYRAGDLEHFVHIESPMKNFSTLEEFEAYPYPDPIKDYNWGEVKAKIDRAKANDQLAVGALATTIFEIAWYLRGMEETLMDMYTEEDYLFYHFDRITDIRCEMAKKYCQLGVDVLQLGDDIATQQAMMFSLDIYRKWLKPRMRKIVDAAKSVNPNIIIDYHSDGNCEDAIEDLIEIGVDVLNPVQPECMDPVKIKKRFGDRLSFRGTIGTQTVMPFGTPDDVRKEVTRMITEVGKGGGLILAPSHLLEPEVPYENIEAFVETVNEFNNRHNG